MIRTIVLGAMFALAACRVQVIDEHGGRWEHLGTRMVDFQADHDEIHAGLKGLYVAIRIDVERAPVELQKVRVNFGNGEQFEPDVRHHFREGNWSRVIDLPGNHRIIRSVELWYRTEQRGEGRAKVAVWGLH